MNNNRTSLLVTRSVSMRSKAGRIGSYGFSSVQNDCLRGGAATVPRRTWASKR